MGYKWAQCTRVVIRKTITSIIKTQKKGFDCHCINIVLVELYNTVNVIALHIFKSINSIYSILYITINIKY